MSQVSRSLGGAELYAARCHDHYNQNVMLALTIHTRAPLDIGNSIYIDDLDTLGLRLQISLQIWLKEKCQHSLPLTAVSLKTIISPSCITR